MEAKGSGAGNTVDARVAICTERVEAKMPYCIASFAVLVAICTERVEAKLVAAVHALTQRHVAICTERVEAKLLKFLK